MNPFIDIRAYNMHSDPNRLQPIHVFTHDPMVNSGSNVRRGGSGHNKNARSYFILVGFCADLAISDVICQAREWIKDLLRNRYSD